MFALSPHNTLDTDVKKKNWTRQKRILFHSGFYDAHAEAYNQNVDVEDCLIQTVNTFQRFGDEALMVLLLPEPQRSECTACSHDLQLSG